MLKMDEYQIQKEMWRGTGRDRGDHDGKKKTNDKKESPQSLECRIC